MGTSIQSVKPIAEAASEYAQSKANSAASGASARGIDDAGHQEDMLTLMNREQNKRQKSAAKNSLDESV